MANENQIVSVEFDINKRIDSQLETILGTAPVRLPAGDHALIGDYVRKIEGTYDVSRSKEDTDNAIQLLYIAYNTTPQEEGKIRVGIDALMSRLIATQQESELKMRSAVKDTDRILKSLRELFADWEEARDSNDVEELKAFVGEDLFDLAKEIKGRAERISADLAKIAETYDGIISETTKATSQGEQALATRLKNKADIEKEISKNNAEREKLESLVKDLQADISKYEKLANEYKSQAETAEERAFIMSIVRVGAQMISAAIPAITAGITGAATGGTSLVAASAVNTARQLLNSETAGTEDDTTALVIEKKKEIADKKADKIKAEREKAELVKKGKELVTEKESIENSTELDEDNKKTKLTAVKNRIDSNEAEIKEKDEKISAASTALNALNAALKSLDKSMGEMADKQEQQATNLRALQMKMLEKVEAYEQEKRNQAAELVKINALLKGQRTEEETIQLAIKSLNLSLVALKRVREIIVEISFFFKSFADFMQQVMNNANDHAQLLQKVLDQDKLTKSYTKRVIHNTDDFFVTQTAQWQAVEIVSAKFVDNFKDGWSKLNKLSGTYLTGDQLKAYLDVAAGQIEEISFKRKEAATAKLAELSRYRDQIKAQS